MYNAAPAIGARCRAIGGGPLRLSINDRILVPIFAMVLFSMTVVAAFVWFSAARQDEVMVNQSIEAAEFALRERLRQIGRAAKEFAWSSDAVRNLDLSFTASWAHANIRRYLFEQQRYDMVFVVDRDGDTVYAQIQGQQADALADQALSHGLDVLIEQAQWAPWQEPEPTMGYLVLEDGVALVAVCALSLDPASEVDLPRGRRMVVVVVERLTKELLRSVSLGLSLSDLTLVSGVEVEARTALPLISASGVLIGTLVWQVHKPGQRFLASVAPALSGAAILFLVFSVIVIHKVRVSAREIERNERRFRDLADASSDWIWEIDADSRLTFLSERFAQATGVSAQARLGKPISELLRPANRHGRLERVRDDIKARRSFRNLLCHYDEGERVRTLRVAGTPIFGPRGEFSGFRGTATDITAEVEAERRIQHLALHDALTGLPNRECWRANAEAALMEAARGGERVAVLCLDMDRFKDINDTLGHGAGDLLIKGCAARLEAAVRPSDTVARLGGDEFVILQTSQQQPDAARDLAKRIVHVLSQPYDLDGHKVLVTASVGVAIASDGKATPERLLQQADVALYRTKEEGRNGFRFFELGMDAFLHRRKRLEHDLRAALAADEFELFYQPKLELSSGQIIGAEALMRWRHPQRQLVLPNEFIGLAEETGLILALGEWVMRAACRQAARWPEIRVSLNISPAQFKHHDLVGLVQRNLDETGISPAQLELEITEGVLLRNTEAAVLTLKRLKELGVRIVMDDFGTRYSGLSYLLSFPFDKLKIDQSFVRGLRARPHADAIITAVVKLGHSLGMRICAEGVETAEQLAFLQAEGCDEIQGHYVGEPVTASSFEQRFLERKVAAVG
jgi:diguanylate cyclase (GGDEF)-like protein/PAS domain S-box-containing protein